jgi:hypothetical protein
MGTINKALHSEYLPDNVLHKRLETGLTCNALSGSNCGYRSSTTQFKNHIIIWIFILLLCLPFDIIKL